MIDSPTSHTIIVNAAEQDSSIDSVTVFQTGRAEIRRRVQVQLKKGHNQITVKHLPSCLAEDSLRVEGTGTAVIFDVVYHSPKLESQYGRRQVDSYSSEEEDEGDLETKYYDIVRDIKKQRGIVENQISFLDRYGHSVDGQNSNLETLERFLDMYESRREALEKKIRELNLEVGRAEKALRVVQKMKSRREIKRRRHTKIAVSVMAKEDGKAELTLTYVVSNAIWIPVYEIRASISSSPNSPSTLAVHYRASLTQTTGEDWSCVNLTLSTATPYRRASIPTLSAWRIGLPPAPGPQRTLRVRSRSRSRSQSQSQSPPQTPQIIRIGVEAPMTYTFRRTQSRSRSRSPTRLVYDTGVGVGSCQSRTYSSSHSSSQSIEICRPADYPPRRSVTPPPYVNRTRASKTYIEEEESTPMVFRQAYSVDVGVLSATFNIQGRSNIPSDQSNHKVLIASLDFQVDPEWVCIPRQDESVFLRCKVLNSSEYTLLPGEASVFIGDSFVSKSQIQHVPPNDSFQLPLGTDPALRVTYTPIRTLKRANAQSGFSFPGRQKQPRQTTVKYSQLVVVRNTRPVAVPELHIIDHVPVSNDSTIKVNVTSPQGLRENNRPTKDDNNEKQYESWVRPHKGVRARWAPPDIGGEGAIEWVCGINAGGEIEVKLGWEVSAPEGTNWVNL